MARTFPGCRDVWWGVWWTSTWTLHPLGDIQERKLGGKPTNF